MNEKIRQYQLRLFNKLFSTLPSVKKINTYNNDLGLKKEITHIYYFHNQKFWFGKSEIDDKFIYIFGVKNKAIHKITPDDALLVIDFDKDIQFNEDSLGLFSLKNSEIHILINNDILINRYPYFNTGNLRITQIQSIDKSLKLNVMDMGALNDDFIDNLEKLLLNQEKMEKDAKSEDVVKPLSEYCEICSKSKSDFKLDSPIKNLKDIRPELCARCIEKILTAEFYDKVKPMIKGNDTKMLDTAKEKFANDQVFEYGLKLLEKYEIISYVGVKKLYFTIDANSYIISKYLEFSDKDNLLLDHIFKSKKSKKKSQKQYIPLGNTTLTRETVKRMNLFINALDSGKTHEEAYKLAKVNERKVENWYRYGEKGESNYVPFYREYKAFHPVNVERNEKMKIFLDELKDSGLENALEKSDLTLEKARSWYGLGEKGHDDYKEFYLSCKQLLPEGIHKKESKKIVDNDELMKQFITLIEDGYSNNKAIHMLKIPKFKVKNWVNQGKLGNKRYVDFYNAYMIQINKQREVEKAKRLERKLEKQRQMEEEKDKLASKSDDTKSDEKTCRLCGRKLNKKTTKDICKRCARKQYASKILLKLLKSIKPEIPFKKDDLKILGLSPLQITDYIWTLQEFNLLTKVNNKYQLKNKERLESFIKNSGINIDEIETPESTVKLSKTCKKCGKTLEISRFFTSENTDDGFEDNCKDCKKLITTAGYLKEISEFIDYGSKFREDDLKPHFPNPFKLQARIWSLVENDLAVKEFDEDYYILTDRKTGEEFLNKYYEKRSTPSTVQSPKEEKIVKDPKDYTKEDQMKIVIRAIHDGKSRKEAAELAHIPLYKITHWYTEGRQGYGKENVKFYQQLKGLEKINEAKNRDIKKRMNLVLDELKKGKEFSQVENSNETEINEWIEKGKRDIEPYSYFYDAYGNIILNSRSKNKESYENKEINRKIFLENFKNGKSKEESAENGDIELSLIHEWYLKGKDGEEPYNEFYEKYIEAKNHNPKPTIPQIDKTDKFGSQNTINQMNIILKNLAIGMDEKDAVENSTISFDTYKYWLNRGKQEFGEIYTQFHNHVENIKNGKYAISKTPQDEPDASHESKLEQLLAPLPEEYEDSFKSSKMNRTGIAWVNIIGKQWVYQRNVNNKPIKFSNSNIYKLYDEVIENNLVWGVRDLKLAKSVIMGNEELNKESSSPIKPEIVDIDDEIDPDIYAPLPQEYEDAFKSSPMNQTGIAWVNKIGNRWIYEKRVNGKLIRIADENIYRLHKKVKFEGHIWGIRDYQRARKIIDIPDDFEVNGKPIELDKSEIIPKHINPEIYAPLPEELERTFNPSQPNKTGIAWVNKSGNNWKYSRNVNRQPIALADENIYELFNKVKNENLEWGIRDYSKAKHIIKIPEDYVPPKVEKEAEEMHTDILSPLPDRYKSSFNPSQPNRTGIAWVNKVGNKWVYQRKVNGIPIKFSDSDIHKLHSIVISNHHVWGILDMDKAKKAIDSTNDMQEDEPVTPTRKYDLTVMNIGLNENNEYTYIIKGMIKNNELLNVLNELKFFEIDIKRVITNTHKNRIDLFIELSLSSITVNVFEKKITEIGGKIK